MSDYDDGSISGFSPPRKCSIGQLTEPTVNPQLRRPGANCLRS